MKSLQAGWTLAAPLSRVGRDVVNSQALSARMLTLQHRSALEEVTDRGQVSLF